MARRMINSSICSSDAFLSLPHSTQALYIQYCINADNEGFISNPKTIMRNVSCAEKDIDLLIENGFIFYFKTGVCVVTHWLIHNTLKNDRNNATTYKTERNCLDLDESKKYVIKADIDINITFHYPTGFQMDSNWIPTGNQSSKSSKSSKEKEIEESMRGEKSQAEKYDTERDIQRALEENRKRIWESRLEDDYY